MPLADVDEFYRRLSETMPAPKGELEYRNEFTLLVAVVLGYLVFGDVPTVMAAAGMVLIALAGILLARRG